MRPVSPAAPSLTGRAASLAVVLLGLTAGESLAAPPAGGTIAPNPEQQGIPSIRRDDAAPDRTRPDRAPAAAEPAFADQDLPSAISRIDLQAPSLSAEVETMLRRFIGRTHISGRDLEWMRGAIWDRYRRHGRFVRVELRVIPTAEAAGGSILQARVHEVRVRAVRVEREGKAPVSDRTLSRILTSARTDIAEGGVLDLEKVESRIRRQLFLGDVDVRATLVPVDQDVVDVKILVSAKPILPLAMLAQYDDNGARAYGRDRAVVGVSIPGRIRAGDQLDLIGIRTDGMSYGRVGYEVPVASLGVRLAAWTSYVDYRVRGETKGHTWQYGAGLIRPLYVTSSAIWVGSLTYSGAHQVDRLDDGNPTGDKHIDSVQGKLDVNFYPSPAQSVHFNVALVGGDLDLSALPAAQAQDQASARTGGGFAKLEFGGAWNILFGPAGRLDARVGVQGQLASKNLDQSEKFALGGPNAVRAYGPVEGLGDDAYVANAEVGYRPTAWLRAFAFYDVGRTRRYHSAWTVEAVPLEYTLQGAGAGLSFSYKPLVASIAYARQIGANPGRSADGLDSDGSRDRSRLLATVTFFF